MTAILGDRSRVEYLLLGPMTVLCDDVALALGGLRQRAVLAVLLMAADTPVRTDALVEMVWDDAPPPKPVASVRAYIANLRRILGGSGRLVTEPTGYRLCLGADRLDIREFEATVTDGRRRLADGDHAGAALVLARSLRLWRGSPLAEFGNHPLLGQQVHRLEGLRMDAVEGRFEAELRLGRGAELIAPLEAEAAANPLRESIWGQLMAALCRADRMVDALVAYRRAETVLVRELGVRPGPALQRLAAEIRGESAGRTAGRMRLRSRDASFGRSRDRERLTAVLGSARDGHGGVAVVTGEHGAGKTMLASEIADAADDLGMVTCFAGHPARPGTPATPTWARVVGAFGGDADAEGRPAEPRAAAVLAALTAAATRTPVLVVLDDLDRADRRTHDVLDELMSSIHRHPIAVLATWRDGGDARPVRSRTFDRLFGRCDVSAIRLRGLESDAAAALVTSVCGFTPAAALVGSVCGYAGGNPFCIREFARMLYDTGRLTAATCVLDAAGVPDAVSAVVRGQMGALSRRARSALSAVALIGADVGSARVAAVLGVAEHDAAALLGSAVAAGLLAMPTPGEYRIRSGLIWAAVLGQIGGAERAALQGAIAGAGTEDACRSRAFGEIGPTGGVSHRPSRPA